LQPWPPVRTVPESSRWQRWTVIVPVIIGTVLGGFLGSLGDFGMAFGMGTVCTDFDETPHAPYACDALYGWLAGGFIGQWALVATGAVLLVVGLKVPRLRLQMAVAAWATVGLSIAWYGLSYYGAYHSYKH
jgi:hypothetical protein